jgi:hypothetical protein
MPGHAPDETESSVPVAPRPALLKQIK